MLHSMTCSNIKVDLYSVGDNGTINITEVYFFYLNNTISYYDNDNDNDKQFIFRPLLEHVAHRNISFIISAK